MAYDQSQYTQGMPALPKLTPVPGGSSTSSATATSSSGGGDLMSFAAGLGGGIRSRNDAAANQSIMDLSRRTGGDTGSPGFNLGATAAKTGAAAQTGQDLAQLMFGAKQSQMTYDLNAKSESDQLAQRAGEINNSQQLQLAQLGLSQQEFGANDLLARAKLAIDTPSTVFGQSLNDQLGFSNPKKNQPFAVNSFGNTGAGRIPGMSYF